MLEQGHHVPYVHHLVPGVIDRNHIVGAVEVLLWTHGEREGSGLVHCPLHLVNVPVGAEQGSVADTHVRAHFLHFLGIPGREGVVVAVGDEYAVLSHGLQVVVRHLDCGFPVGAVVVVPVLAGHQHGHSEAEKGSDGGHDDIPAALEKAAEQGV